MSKNKISAVLSDTDKAKALKFLTDFKTTVPFLVNLSPEDRKKSRKMGSKSVDYVNMNLQGAQAFGHLIPAHVNVAEFWKDVTLVNQLIPIQVVLQALLEDVNDTIFAAGSDAMATSDSVYTYLKEGAKTNAGVKALTADIAARFKGQGRKDIKA